MSKVGTGRAEAIGDRLPLKTERGKQRKDECSKRNSKVSSRIRTVYSKDPWLLTYVNGALDLIYR
jgi:hypothetical protein